MASIRETTFQNVADLFSMSDAVLVFDNGEEIESKELVRRAEQRLGQLRAQGFAQGDRLALHRGNDVEALELLLAAALGGIVIVAVNTKYSQVEVDDLVARSGARHPQLSHHGDVEPDVCADAQDLPFIIFTTSGTTSKPKMVLHHQRSVIEHTVDIVDHFEYSDADTVLMALPLCGTFGLSSLIAAVASGARVVVNQFSVDGTSALTHREQITAMNGSDDMFHRLLLADADLSHLRISGYAQFNTSLSDIVSRAEAKGATLTGLYGMSEVQALFSLRDPQLDSDGRSRAGGMLVSPRASARVVDGELQLRGPSLFAGYLQEGGDAVDDELTAQYMVTDDDGVVWFKTGDLAEMDDDRTFHYISRLGDILRLGGFLVAPAEIAEALCSAPGVADAQVVAVGLETGSRPVAFVIPEEGATISEDEVIEHCRSRLARYKVPVRVVSLDEFPITDGPNGVKIRLTELRDRATELLS